MLQCMRARQSVLREGQDFPYTSHGNVLTSYRLVLTPTLTLNDPLHTPHSVKCTERLHPGELGLT